MCSPNQQCAYRRKEILSDRGIFQVSVLVFWQKIMI